MDDVMMTVQEVAGRFKVSPQTIRAGVKRGGFPAPVVLIGTHRWREADIDQWVKQQVEQHDKHKPED